MSPEQRAAVIDFVSKLEDYSLSWLAWEKLAHLTIDGSEPSKEVLTVAAELAEDVARTSASAFEANPNCKNSEDNAISYGASAKAIRERIACLPS